MRLTYLLMENDAGSAFLSLPQRGCRAIERAAAYFPPRYLATAMPLPI